MIGLISPQTRFPLHRVRTRSERRKLNSQMMIYQNARYSKSVAAGNSRSGGQVSWDLAMICESKCDEGQQRTSHPKNSHFLDDGTQAPHVVAKSRFAMRALLRKFDRCQYAKKCP
jgi:hypothetical protein